MQVLTGGQIGAGEVDKPIAVSFAFPRIRKCLHDPRLGTGTLSAGNADVALMQGAGWSPQRRGNTLATRWVTVGAGGRKNMVGDTLEGRFAT